MASQSSLTGYIVRHTYLVRAGLISLGILVMLTTLTIPFFKNTRQMSSKIVKQREESKKLAEKVSILSGLDENVLNERVKTLDRALPAKKDVVLYLSAIDGLSRELELNFGGISLSPGEVTDASGSAEAVKTTKNDAAPGLHTLETDIEITGTKDNIYTFLRFIEEATPLMQIKDVHVTELKGQSYALGLRLGMLYALTDLKQVKGAITLFDEKEEKYFQELASFRSFNTLSDVFVQDTGLGKNDLFTEIEEIKPQQ